MKKILFSLTLLFTSLFAGQINIAVAANVSYVIEELVKQFNITNPDTKIVVTLGSSGKLTAQIKNGAPYNIFMSANMDFPQSLYNEKIAITKPIIYAQGGLVILSSKEIDFKNGLNILKNEELSKIAVANPKTAPYGIATKEALEKANIYEDIKNKFVYGESISQTVVYTVTAANIGIISKSSLFDRNMSSYKENVNWIDIDSSLYTPIDQGIVMLNNAKDNKEAKAFYEFILSQNAKEIFRKYGYMTK